MKENNVLLHESDTELYNFDNLQCARLELFGIEMYTKGARLKHFTWLVRFIKESILS